MAEITLRSDLAELTALTEFIDRFVADSALSADVGLHLQLVLEELVVNAISYGYPEGGAGSIRVQLARTPQAIEIELVDDGIAFDPRTLPAPDLDAPLDERPLGGLGVHLVRQFVDEIDYRRDSGRNHLRLRKRLAPPPPDRGNQRR